MIQGLELVANQCKVQLLGSKWNLRAWRIFVWCWSMIANEKVSGYVVFCYSTTGWGNGGIYLPSFFLYVLAMLTCYITKKSLVISPSLSMKQLMRGSAPGYRKNDGYTNDQLACWMLIIRMSFRARTYTSKQWKQMIYQILFLVILGQMEATCITNMFLYGKSSPLINRMLCYINKYKDPILNVLTFRGYCLPFDLQRKGMNRSL